MSDVKMLRCPCGGGPEGRRLSGLHEDKYRYACSDLICKASTRWFAMEAEARTAWDAMNRPQPAADAGDVERAIARRIAKRQHGEAYEGYESTHAEAAKDYARAAISALRARPAQAGPVKQIYDEADAGLKAWENWLELNGAVPGTIYDAVRDAFLCGFAAAPRAD